MCGVSGDGAEIFDGAVEHFLVEAADGELGEVGAGAVGFDRGFVAVLLVAEDGVGVAIEEVGDVGDAAGLAAGEPGELAEDTLDVVVVVGGEAEADDEGDHKGECRA